MTSSPAFTFRHPTPADAQAIVDLCNAGDIAYTGQAQTDLTQILEQWEEPYFDKDRDAWLAEADGRVVGYLESSYEPGAEEIDVFFNTHPDYDATSLAAALLALGEEHARELIPIFPPDKPLMVRTAFYASEQSSRRQAEASGFQVVRFFYRMDIDFDAPPAPVPPVPGILIRLYDPEKDEIAAYEALEDSFEDHWHHRRLTLEEWRTGMIASERYDPALWVMAEADGVVVGGAIGTYLAGVPWVRMLGVRRTWRQHGIGQAVLLALFQIFYARGDRKLGLGVDAASPTNATRLYERAGMRISDQRVVYTKPIPR